jgi:hypothetical protein
MTHKGHLAPSDKLQAAGRIEMKSDAAEGPVVEAGNSHYAIGIRGHNRYADGQYEEQDEPEPPAIAKPAGHRQDIRA